MKKIILLLCLFFLSTWQVHAKQSFPAIPSGLEAVKLGDVLGNPAVYEGNKILLVGSVANVCPTSGCHFVFHDSGDTITIYPKGFKLPKLKKGQAVKIYAEVKVGEKNTIISALGLEVK